MLAIIIWPAPFIGCDPPPPAEKPKADRTATLAEQAQAAAPQYAPKFDPNNVVHVPVVSAPNDDDGTVREGEGPAPWNVREQASAAVTAKGKGTVDSIATPVSTYFAVKDQVVFQYQIPKAMEIFVGLNNRRPRDFAEFRREIIERQSLRMPELPPTHRYLYDPETGHLLVEHPRE